MKIRLKILKLAFALACFAVLIAPFAARGQQTGKPGVKTPTAEPVSVGPPPVKKPVDYNRFTHQTHLGLIKVPNTNFAREMKCESCHVRFTAREFSNSMIATTDRNKQLTLKFPGHKACVECHVVQFTTKPQQTCVICHNTQEGLNARPPERDFPARYDFNAFFDSKQHALHANYKLSDGKLMECAFCHKPTQKALAVTMGSHPECYVCHTPGSFDKKANVRDDCVVCHTQRVKEPVEPFDAKLVSRAYGAKFSHADHYTKYAIDCKECHTVEGGYNQDSPTSPMVKQHNTTAQTQGKGCFTCHNGKDHFGRRVFSGDDAKACVRCHNLNSDIKVVKVRG